MKLPNKILRHKYSICVAIAALLLGMSACTKNFESYNTDNTGVPDGSLTADFNALGLYLKSAEMAIYNFSGGGDPNSFQVQQNLNADCFSGYMMSPNPFGGQTNLNYFLVTGWNGEAFKVGYLSVMSPISKLRNTGVENTFPSIWAVAQIVQVAGMSRVTDIYGPVPYSKAGTAKTGIAYDSQQDIYNRFFRELDTATTNLRTYISSGKPLPFNFSTFDVVYAGNFTQWLKFANSLRLRLAMHIIKADPTTAKAQAEIALNPANGGVITDNTDNMTVKVSGAGFTNPLVFLQQNWADSRVNASIQCYLTGYKDPRTSKYLDKSTDTSFPAQYKGIRIGSITGSNAKSDYVNYSSINLKDGPSPFFTLTTPVQLMTAAEVYFLRAEAALHGWSNAGGTSQQLYEQGITTSLAQWGVASATYINDAISVPDAYTDPKAPANNAPSPSSTTIKWNDAAPDNIKMERIITQKWIAMFPEGQEAWTEFRRTGYPKLFPVVHNNSAGTISTDVQIRRLPFQQNEYNTNLTEVTKAVQMLGGPDNGGTRLWWDKP
ncbi:SusD/RagB-like outer membrane lipoprotein [Chitinophaga niastensis]|uniref:SusD/RagB-like outer membrane lipoprotein n=1 Tax=Chitinophaga niastensis TaxID=536980 RepID=A0A2P8HKG8_CHINA|nr:RagB/SusD family nutrient uptake outer membrane protein [Chitinophaga niastensis]PSL46707.1 SusD/RagB-like outer membrane lipoprotein [Chitinophaga niastensis]